MQVNEGHITLVGKNPFCRLCILIYRSIVERRLSLGVLRIHVDFSLQQFADHALIAIGNCNVQQIGVVFVSYIDIRRVGYCRRCGHAVSANGLKQVCVHCHSFILSALAA